MISLTQKRTPVRALPQLGETSETPPLPYAEAQVHTDTSEANPEASSERVWLQRAQQGDLAAFDWLMTRYRERAVRLAAHVLRRPADAEDLVQEAFLRAFSQIRDFRGDCAFYTWLYRIVIRLCLNRMRTPDWRHEFDGSPEYDRQNGCVSQWNAPPSENRLLIENLLDRLSPPLRAALILREMEGLDYSEIAEALQIPVGTVRSRLSAAREQFRTLWKRTIEETENV